MALNTLETAYVNGEVIDASHVNELTLALLQDFVGRDANGIPSPLQNLGTLAIPWNNLYAQGIILGGQAIDTSQITSAPNRVVSGATRPLSSLGDFLRADGTTTEYTVLGDTVDLILAINNSAVSVDTDIVVAGVSTAPSTNNTAAINMPGLSGSLYAGELDDFYPEFGIDAVGSEITALTGQVAAFMTEAGEIFQALIKDGTTISNAYRGYYFDDTGTPINRDTITDNELITLLKIGWVFVEDNGTTVDTSYRTPFVSYNAPTSPQSGDYWFDISNQVWKRYSGVSFDIINRILIGQVVSDSTGVIASRSYDFTKDFQEQNNADIEVTSGEIVKTKSEKSLINVYGTELSFDLSKPTWNVTTDLESGVIEAPNTTYFLYLSDEGQEVISDKKPYVRRDLAGRYHPYESWRFVGTVFNDGSQDFEFVRSEAAPDKAHNYRGDGVESPVIGMSVDDKQVYERTYNISGTGNIDTIAQNLNIVNCVAESAGEQYMVWTSVEGSSSGATRFTYATGTGILSIFSLSLTLVGTTQTVRYTYP